MIRRFLPAQHGAWAMLLLPYLVGVISAGPAWVHLPLLVAWLGGYLLSYFAFRALGARTWARVRPQLLVHGSITALAGAVTLAARPGLLRLAPVYLVLLAVNVAFAWRRRQRALLNDLALVLQGCLMVPVAAVAAGEPATSALRPFVPVLLYLVGTVPYVKTMIRNRGDVRYLRASVAYHLLALPAAAAVAWPLAIPFAWFLARATVLPRRRLTPVQVGLTEIAASVALLVAVPAFTT